MQKKNNINSFYSSKKQYVWNFGIDGGLCIMSKFPVKQKKQIRYKNGCSSDAMAAKGVLYNEIEISKGSSLHLFTSHTQASYKHFPDINSKSVQIRLNQFTELRNFIEDTTKNALPTDIILLVGDLNVNGRLNQEDGVNHSEEYKLMMDVLRGNISIVKKKKSFEKINHEYAAYEVDDLFYKELKEHPVTSCDLFNADYYKNKEDMKTKKCLDFMLKFRKIDKNGNQIKESNNTQNCPIFRNFDIQKFDINDKKFVHLSDHYGLSTEIVIN